MASNRTKAVMAAAGIPLVIKDETFEKRPPPKSRADLWTGAVVRVRIPKDATVRYRSANVDHDYLRAKASYKGGNIELFFCGLEGDELENAVGKTVTARLTVREKIYEKTITQPVEGNAADEETGETVTVDDPRVYVDFVIDPEATPTHEFKVHTVALQCVSPEKAVYALALGDGLLIVTPLEEEAAVAA